MSMAPHSLLSYFDVSATGFPWSATAVEEIEKRRALLGDTLLFDTLLSLGGIRQPDSLYPPVDVESLERLLEAIESSQYDVLKKECLVYFLLKWHMDGREVRFQQERCILPQFSALADAYWHLDSGNNVARAVSILSDSRLNTDYASKILQAIFHSPDSSPLILRYIRTAKPLLTEPDDISMYADALAESNLLEAWQFQRSFGETDATRPRLLKRMFNWCVTPNPRPVPLGQLLALPMTPYEHSILEAHVLEQPKGIPPSGLAVLQHLICVRLIQGGKYAEAIKMDRRLSSRSSTKVQAQDRTQMMQDLYAALSPFERALIDTDLEQSMPPSGSTPGGSGDSMSQSWVDLRPSLPKTNGNIASHTSTPVRDLPNPVLHRSGAPRFGGSSIPPSSSLNNSTSRGSPLPTIPISAPRKSLNLSSLNGFSSSTSSARSKLPAPLFASTSSTRLFSSSTGPQFDSAAKRSNAFYQPPVNEPQSTPNQNPIVTSTNAFASDDVDMDAEDQRADDAELGNSLSYSVFGGSGPAKHLASPTTDSSTKTNGHASSSTNSAPPGAFSLDEEDQSGGIEDERPSRATRSSRNSTSTAQRATRATRATRDQPPENFRMSIPGSLMDVDDLEEEEDQVAPLPAPSKATRKSRASVVSSEGSEDDTRSRRRSTRLSVATSETKKPEKPKKASKKKR
ncbi:nuclear pore complex assembly-domain-containing protein [Mycena floridula]|nr:nuclear pore complex assembly-domain-containing protein [Mycena floridula]